MWGRASWRSLLRGVPVVGCAAAVVNAGQVSGLLAVASCDGQKTTSAARGSSWTASWTASAAQKTSKGKASPLVAPPMALQEEFDVVIVGGGIIGLATAREVLRRYPKLTVAVVEKEREVAAHQTGHNSGVIHAGMYYPPGSVMAATCVRGSKLMYDYAAEQGIPVSRCGKLIVAVNEQEHAHVAKLFAQGTANGVPGLAILTGAQVAAQEPAISAAYSALWSPNTGVIDYSVVARHLAQEILNSGRADIKLSFEANVRKMGA